MKIVARDSMNESVYEMEPCKRTLFVEPAWEGYPSRLYQVEFPWTYFSVITRVVDDQIVFEKMRLFFSKSKVDFSLSNYKLYEIRFGFHVASNSGVCMPILHSSSNTRDQVELEAIDSFFFSSFHNQSTIIIYGCVDPLFVINRKSIQDWSQIGIDKLFYNRLRS